MDEVTCAFDDDGVVVGEGLLPSPQFVIPERDVGVAQMMSVGTAARLGSPTSTSARKARLAVTSRRKTADASRRAELSRAFW